MYKSQCSDPCQASVYPLEQVWEPWNSHHVLSTHSSVPQECSIPRLLWWGAGQNGWGELAMPQQHQGSQGPPCCQPARMEPLSLLHQGLGGPTSPALLLLTEPELLYLLNSATPAAEQGCAGTCWTSHPPSSIVSSLLPPRRVTAACGGLKGMGKWPLTEGESNWENYSELSTLFFCKWFSNAGIFGDSVLLLGSQQIQSSITQWCTDLHWVESCS